MKFYGRDTNIIEIFDLFDTILEKGESDEHGHGGHFS